MANLYTRVPGYTSEVGRGQGAPRSLGCVVSGAPKQSCLRLPLIMFHSLTVPLPQGSLGDDTNEFDAGAVYQFGYKGAAARSTIMTRTEGVTGLTGKGGWYVHWTLGAPKNFEVHVDQLPRGTSIIYATRYPAGTTFSIVRVQNWLLQPSVLRAGANLAAVLADPTGDVYFFDGKLLYMKIYDLHETPYQGREDVEYRGVQVPGSRWELYYNVTAKFTSCAATPAPTQNGKSFAAQFCAMAVSGWWVVQPGRQRFLHKLVNLCPASLRLMCLTAARSTEAHQKLPVIFSSPRPLSMSFYRAPPTTTSPPT